MVYCKAPFTNMYFNVQGNASPCWLTVGEIGKWKHDEVSIRDLWFGEIYSAWRETPWPEPCTRHCKQNYTGHVQGGTLQKAYEHNKIYTFPSMMELEFTNQCNYACIMCSEMLSSSIRANKGMDPLPNAYTDQFFEQLEEFIPYLEELRINGGEPFVQKEVYRVLDMVQEIKPDITITVATNGSQYNAKVEKYIKSFPNFRMNISIDSLTPSIYEQIRVNGKLERVLDNFQKFRKHVNHICVQVNPMPMNYHEMVNYVDFVEENDVYLAFNTIRYPKDCSLIFDPELERKYNELKPLVDNYPKKDNQWYAVNQLVNEQMPSWIEEQKKGNEGYNKA